MAPRSWAAWRARRPATYYWILPVLLLEGVMLGLPMAFLPELQNTVFGSRALTIVGGFAGLKGLVSIVYSPVLGALSDRYGRRPLLLLCLLLLAVPTAVMAATGSLWAYTVADAAWGLIAGSLSVAFAYIADLVDEDRRTAAFGIAMAAFGGSVAGSPIPGQMLFDGTSSEFVFTLATAVGLANVVYLLLVLPESADLGASGARRARGPPAKERLMQAAGLVCTRPLLRLLCAIVFWDHMAEQMLVNILLVYLNRQLGFTPFDTAVLLGVVGVAAFLSLGIVVRVLKHYIGDTRTLQIGLFANAVAIGLYGFADKVWQAQAIPALCVLGFVVFPTACSLASTLAPPGQQGEYQGAVSGMRMLAEGFSPLLFGWLFDLFQHTSVPGLPFLLASVGVLVGFGLALRIPRDPAEHAELVDEEPDDDKMDPGEAAP